MLFEVCEAYQKSVWYTNVNSTSAPTCNNPTPVPISGCGCSCAYVPGTKPTWTCDLNSTTYEWSVLPLDFSAKRQSTFNQVVLLDYQDQANQTVNGNWQFDDGSGVVATNFTFSATHVRLRYLNPAVPILSASATSGSGILTCCDHTSTGTQAIYGWFWERARYTNDISAFGVYGSAAQYAAWTIEITTTEAIVRDGNGTIQYQWALANYDMDGLRVAIDGTAELVGRRIALNTGTNLRTRAATAIPPQGPKAVGQAIATEAKIVLRTAGDEVEGYQVVGLAGYAANTVNTVPPYIGGRRTETYFSGTLAEYRQGFALTEEEVLGQTPAVYPNAPSNTGLSVTPPCPTGAGSCGITASMNPVFGGDGAFGNSTDVLTGTAWEGTFTDDTSNGYSLPAGNGTTCVRYACVNESEYWWYKAKVMYEVERI